MADEQNNTNGIDRMGALLSKIERRLEAGESRLQRMEEKEATPIEARITTIEARIRALENMLTEETPTGKTRLNKLGRSLRR